MAWPHHVASAGARLKRVVSVQCWLLCLLQGRSANLPGACPLYSFDLQLCGSKAPETCHACICATAGLSSQPSGVWRVACEKHITRHLSTSHCDCMLLHSTTGLRRPDPSLWQFIAHRQCQHISRSAPARLTFECVQTLIRSPQAPCGDSRAGCPGPWPAGHASSLPPQY